MTALKPRDIDAYIKKPEFKHTIFLIFGPDAGLVSERANALAAKSGVDLNDPFSLIRLDADEAASDTARIATEAHTIGMFGGTRLIRISGNTRKDLMKSIKPVLDLPSEDAIIIIEAGDLNKTSALRKNLEAHKEALCIGCYPDTGAAIKQLINEELSSNNLNIDRETLEILASMLGENRLISRGELKKLALYCKGKSEVTLDDVYAIVGDVSKLVVDHVIDAAACGDPKTLQSVLPNAVEAGNKPDMILAAMLRHFQLLQNARTKIEKNNQPPSSVIMGMRPPVHFSRKDKVTKAMNIWTLPRIGRVLERLNNAMLDARKNALIGTSTASTALLAISLEANALSRQRR